MYGTETVLMHKPFIVVWYIEHCANLGFLQALRPLETVPVVKDVANVIDAFKKQAAADRAVIIKVHRDNIFCSLSCSFIMFFRKTNTFST